MKEQHISEKLMRGNFVYVGEILCTVLEVLHNGITYDSFDGDVVAEFAEWDNVRLVPLTEAILSNNGFRYDDINGDLGWWTYRSKTCNYRIRLLYCSEQASFLYESEIEVFFVNHLQNLIQVLLGNELSICPQ